LEVLSNVAFLFARHGEQTQPALSWRHHAITKATMSIRDYQRKWVVDFLIDRTQKKNNQSILSFVFLMSDELFTPQ
jgi:hypothetical protein